MRNIQITRNFYVNLLGFQQAGATDYEGYLMLKKNQIEIHFFAFPTLDPLNNYGQAYIRTNEMDTFYQELLDRGVPIHPNGHLAVKPWGQREFSLLDPDHNLLTFGESWNG